MKKFLIFISVAILVLSFCFSSYAVISYGEKDLVKPFLGVWMEIEEDSCSVISIGYDYTKDMILASSVSGYYFNNVFHIGDWQRILTYDKDTGIIFAFDEDNDIILKFKMDGDKLIIHNNLNDTDSEFVRVK